MKISRTRHTSRALKPRALLVSSLLALGCSQGPAFATVTELPEPARHPAGSDVDPELTLPAVARRGQTTTGLVVLETPANPATARTVIALFFLSIVAESPGALSLLLAPNAVMQDGARREVAAAAWAARFARFDYRSLAGETVYRDSELQIREDERDLWVEVPIEVVWGARPRMLGDQLTLRLTPKGSSFVVAEILETFR